MNGKIIILRPQPGADETAARARALGLTPIVSALFALRPLTWSGPGPAGFDAVMLTSANAARHGGEGLAPYLSLPCYAVGESSAQAARSAGFGDVRTGPSDGPALIALAAADGIGRALHVAGRHHVPLRHPSVAVTHVAVYTSDPVPSLPPEVSDGLVLLHSPRAAALLARLAGQARGTIRLAAISPATALAAGEGWRSIAVAAAPRDQALLELAAKLCQTDAGK